MIAIFDYSTIILSTYLLYRNRKNLLLNGRYIVFLLSFIFYVFPLYIDCLYAFPEYREYAFGFTISSVDDYTRISYDFVIIIFQLVLLYWRQPANTICKTCSEIRLPKNINTMLVIGMMVPVLIDLIFMQNVAMIYTPQWREVGLFATNDSYFWVEHLSYVGITCSCLLLFKKGGKLLSLSRILSIAFLYMNICIQGKRAIMFFALVNIILIIYILIIEQKKQGKSTAMYSMGAIMAVILVSLYMVSMTFNVKVERGYDGDDTNVMVTTTRVDFLRDDRVRLAIFAENNEDWTMLDYKGQTIIYDFMTIVPLNQVFYYFRIPIYSYQQFFTSCLMHTNFDKENNYMTTCIFAELISNFGIIIGTLLMCVLCIFIGRLYDQYPYPLNSIIMCLFVLANLFCISYIILYLEFTLLSCYYYKKKV